MNNIGSNNAVTMKLVGMESLKSKLKRLYGNIGGKVMREALMEGAQVYKDAIERATPVDTGQARRNVIIYERKRWSAGSLVQTADQLALLVGYEKSKAYYMYFREFGYTHKSGRRIPAKPTIRAAILSAENSVLSTASRIVTAGINREAVNA